jgi:uncharacterized membrane protein
MNSAALYETMVGRTVAAFSEALEEIGVADDWMQSAIRELLPHIACELITEEQQRGQPMTLSEAARWLCDQAEVGK